MKKKILLSVFLGIVIGALIQPVTIFAANGIRGEFSGSVSLVPPHKLHFGDFNDATGVSLWKVFNNTVGFSAAGMHFGNAVANKDFDGVCTLGTSCTITFVNTYAATPACVATDTTAANAVKAVTSGGPPVTTLTITGTGTDVIAYHCFAVTG